MQTSETSLNLNAEKMWLLFTSKNQLLKVKSAFKSGRIPAHEYLEVINNAI